MAAIRFVIITGLSGAGKTEAMRIFEDLGYFCVDNLPPALIPKFAELCAQSEGRINKIALVSDIRGGEFFDALFDSLEALEQVGFEYTILFLEAADETLVRRFKASRRRHPLAPEGSVLDGIRAERKRLEELRGRAHRVIDTSEMTPHQLKEEIVTSFLDRQAERMTVTVLSFGFKNGLPLDADVVFDVRFLANPHWVDSLAAASGKDSHVVEYVFKWPITQRFMEKLYDLMDFLLPQYVNEGKSHLIVGIGCTGGRHRSVAVAERLGEFLRSRGYKTLVDHRDLDAG